MDSKKNNSVQFTADNEMADLTGNTINVTESEFLNKLQELKEREDFLTQKETVLAQKEQALQAAKDAMAQKEAELNDKYVHLQEMELQAKNGSLQFFEEKFAAFKKQLAQREAQCVSERETLEAEKAKRGRCSKGGNPTGQGVCR